MNHDGFKHNLLDIPHAALDFLLQDAWYGYVTKKVKHRKTMKDLPGIYEELTLLDRNQMTPQELGKTMALQSGAFVSVWSHAKYDPTKTPICTWCLVSGENFDWTGPLNCLIALGTPESFGAGDEGLLS